MMVLMMIMITDIRVVTMHGVTSGRGNENDSWEASEGVNDNVDDGDLFLLIE